MKKIEQAFEEAYENNNIIGFLTECVYGRENILPETILETRMEINSITKDAEGYSILEEGTKLPKIVNINTSNDEQVTKAISSQLDNKLSKDQISQLATDPEQLGKLIHCIRNKVETAENAKRDAAASKQGFFSNLITMLRRCLVWLYEKLKMVVRVGKDIVTGRPIGTNQVKADFKYISDKRIDTILNM